MRILAAALVGLSIVAADIAAQSGDRGRGGLPTDVGPVDVAALQPGDSDFEQNGGISNDGLRLVLGTIAGFDRVRFVPPGARDKADQERQTRLRGLGRLERRDLIGPLLGFVSNPETSQTAHLALALTLRAHARPEQPDPEIAAAVSQLVTTAPPAILGQLPYSTVEQFETAETRLAAIL